MTITVRTLLGAIISQPDASTGARGRRTEYADGCDEQTKFPPAWISSADRQRPINNGFSLYASRAQAHVGLPVVRLWFGASPNMVQSFSTSHNACLLREADVDVTVEHVANDSA
jgi:hypothetical protein